RAALESLARELGVESRVFLLGRVPDVAAWLQRASVYVQPSRWEGFGLAVLEAMVCGLPVVATDVSSLPELVVDGETGLLVPVADVEALALAIARADPRFGHAGRERAQRDFSVDRMADRTVALYDALLSASS
ncbi:MAG TPA: glycosyltransferase, partial [Gaiellaceae bacterium]|nr:glycosyltransferase [Gaiellaceae bacterium]